MDTTNDPFYKSPQWTVKCIVIVVSALVSAGICIMAIVFFSTLPDVSGLNKHNPDTTALMRLRLLQAESKKQTYKIRQYWVPFNAIPDLLKKAVRITEDASFYQHEGIDYTELKEAIKENWEEKRFVRGASTITQQLAKNLYLTTDRSLLRKLKEYFIAKRLEEQLSKARIFHLYLNIIELGDGLFGVEAASRYYFGKSVRFLTLEEIVRLTAIIPRPLITDPNGGDGWLRWKARWILRTLKRYGYINQHQYRRTVRRFQ